MMNCIPFYPCYQPALFLSPSKPECKPFFPKAKLMATPSSESYCETSTDDENVSDLYVSPEDGQTENKENELGITILNNKRQKTVIDETKFKTEMCKNWQTKGFCNYEGKCKFAHGPHELVKKDFVNKTLYKSKPCISFHTKHYCPYGLRCLFIHHDKPLKAVVQKNFYFKKLNALKFSQDAGSNKRLKFFEESAQKTMSKQEVKTPKPIVFDSKKLFPCDLWELSEVKRVGKSAEIKCEIDVEEMVKFAL